MPQVTLSGFFSRYVGYKSSFWNSDCVGRNSRGSWTFGPGLRSTIRPRHKLRSRASSPLESRFKERGDEEYPSESSRKFPLRYPLYRRRRRSRPPWYLNVESSSPDFRSLHCLEESFLAICLSMSATRRKKVTGTSSPESSCCSRGKKLETLRRLVISHKPC